MTGMEVGVVGAGGWGGRTHCQCPEFEDGGPIILWLPTHPPMHCAVAAPSAVAVQAVFPVVLRILPTCVFNKKDPIVLGVDVVEGQARIGTPLVAQTEAGLIDLGRIAGMEINHKVRAGMGARHGGVGMCAACVVRAPACVHVCVRRRARTVATRPH